MTKSEEILKKINEIFPTNPQEADRLYKEEYLPLARKEARKLQKEVNDLWDSF